MFVPRRMHTNTFWRMYMKWFKHETDVIHSEKMAKLIEEFGFEGYGRYWRIMEIIAERMDETDFSRGLGAP